MKCPYCEHTENKVIDSRHSEDGASIRRRRECCFCGRRFTTYEVREDQPLMVLKKDGSLQAFDRGKILAGLIRACEKRPVPYSALERIVEQVEQTLQNRLDDKVTRSSEIGEMVLEQLRKTDEVAYIRFASVYRQFKDIDSFLQELSQMRTTAGNSPQEEN